MTEQTRAPEPIPGPPPVPPAPPARSNRRMITIIVAVVVAVLVLVGVGILGLVAGSDDAESGPAAQASEPAPSETASGESLEGDGYAYDLPDEWQDITESVLADNPGTSIDSASAWGASISAGRANLIVEHPDAGGVTDLDTARDQLQANLEASFESEIETLDNREIGGLEMAGLHVVRTNEADVEVDQTAYITLVDDAAYIITTSRKADDEEPEALFDAIYDSWSWE